MIVACTRSELARLTGLTPAAITIIIDELFTNGLVLEGKNGKSNGGRPGIYLTINPGYGYIGRIHFSRTKFNIGICDFRKRIITRGNVSIIRGRDCVYHGIRGGSTNGKRRFLCHYR